MNMQDEQEHEGDGSEEDRGRGVAFLALGLAIGAAAAALVVANRREAPRAATSQHVNNHYRRFAGLGALPLLHPVLHGYRKRAAGVHRALNRLGIGDELAARITPIVTPGRSDIEKHVARFKASELVSDPWEFGTPRAWRYDHGKWRWVNVPPDAVARGGRR